VILQDTLGLRRQVISINNKPTATATQPHSHRLWPAIWARLAPCGTASRISLSLFRIVRDLIALMADPASGVRALSGAYSVSKARASAMCMRRMAASGSCGENAGTEIATWRAACPDITFALDFIVGYPGRDPKDEFQTLLYWLTRRNSNRLSAVFSTMNVAGARSKHPADPCWPDQRQERWDGHGRKGLRPFPEKSKL